LKKKENIFVIFEKYYEKDKYFWIYCFFCWKKIWGKEYVFLDFFFVFENEIKKMFLEFFFLEEMSGKKNRWTL